MHLRFSFTYSALGLSIGSKGLFGCTRAIMTSSPHSGASSHVAVFGAAGLLGCECVYQLLQKGHKV